MAKIEIYAPFLESIEGGYVNDPKDPGGATNKGITLKIWKQVGYDKNGDGVINKYDVMEINSTDFRNVLKKEFWDKCHADDINDQSVANILVDWFYNSGYTAIHHLQNLLDLKRDGVIGPVTLKKLNSWRPEKLFHDIWIMRMNFLRSLKGWSHDGRGWTARMNSIKYGSLTYIPVGTRKQITVKF